MKKSAHITLIAIFAATTAASAQAQRGMYINGFSEILGQTEKEDSVLQYLRDSSFNAMTLYELGSLNYSDVTEMNQLANFIRRARNQYGILNVGAAGETKSFFEELAGYNNARADVSEKINVFNLEFEFWIAASVGPGGYYCVKYLQPAGCSCDTSGAFAYYLNLLKSMDSLTAAQGIVSETYLGWFNNGQGRKIQAAVDRILLHAYRTDNNSVWGYSKTRLGYLAGNNTTVNVAPIFSSEPEFMGPWLEQHSQQEAYEKYEEDFQADNPSWKQYIHLTGNQWFCWGFMPKPEAGSCNPVVPDGGQTNNVAGTTAVIHWNALPPTDSIIIRYAKEPSTTYSYIRLANTGQTSLQLSGLTAGTDYSWRIKTVCGATTGNYSAKYFFTTLSTIGIDDPGSTNPSEFMVWPNPASDKLYWSVASQDATDAQLVLSDLTGKALLVEKRELVPGTNQFEIDLSTFSKGMYLLALIPSSGTKSVNRIYVE